VAIVRQEESGSVGSFASSDRRGKRTRANWFAFNIVLQLSCQYKTQKPTGGLSESIRLSDMISPFGQTKSGQEPNIKAMSETGITEGHRLNPSIESASL